METYLVGGAVRDALMGLPVKDRDWVVVGSTPQAMLDQGFVPVGRDFPVFLHPHSKEEYALARTERKTAPGYRGFAIHAAPEVSLEDDLGRRDLTINAMAIAARHAPALVAHDNGPGAHLIDPYGGRSDLAHKRLRHVTLAFREDPVRILRTARFAARFADFTVAPETLRLMQDMVASGEVDHLVPERVWQELATGLMEAQPERMFAVLRACGALAVLLPELDRLWGVTQRADYHPEIDTGSHVMLVLQRAAVKRAPLPVVFACLTHDLGKGETPTHLLPRHLGHEGRSAHLTKALCQRLRVPLDCRELADVVAREHGNIHQSMALGAAAVVRLLERCDAFRKPQRFAEILLACECDAQGRKGLQDTAYPQAQRLLCALSLAQAVDTETVARTALSAGATGPRIGVAIHAARVAAVAQNLA
ncbi:MAG: multifunctional CCA addition/repair protein [Rhodoferax sp.]|nr:multifunctional CCA addition/repair protein [Rhodoferax sp.]MCF8211901.1 multifunctional CCA addition/repair protein [Rhodoferax sp.]